MVTSRSAQGETVRYNAAPVDQLTRWELNRFRLVAGWYMLEIEHSLASIGCVLTLANESGLQEHLLLTSKPVCKRIIRLEHTLQSCSLTIDQPDCSLERVSLTGLTPGFAMSRIRQRLEHRGCINKLDSLDASALYADYRRHVHEAIFPTSYAPDSEDTSPASAERDGAVEERSNCLLLLIREEAQQATDDSVLVAVSYARQAGWQIAWQPDIGSDSPDSDHYKARRVFRMPIPTGYRCRPELFHQMLQAADDDSVLVYADHDHVSADGERSDPVLKPAWNPELLLNRNYIGFPWMASDDWFRRAEFPAATRRRQHDRVLLAASLGVNDVGNSVKDQSDQVLQDRSVHQVIQPLCDQQVTRVPRVLATRLLPDGMNACIDDDGWQQSIADALSRAGSKASVQKGLGEGVSHVIWPLPASPPAVDIIIPTRDKVEILRTCIESVLGKTTYPNYRILLVDNDSEEPGTESYYRSLAGDSRIELLRFAGPFNYSAINNHAVAQGNSPLLVLLNNDTEVISENWLEEMVRQAMRPEIGCVGAKLHYTNGRIQHGGVIVGINGVAGHAHRYSPGHAAGYCQRLICSQNLTAVTAACLAVRRATFEQVGGLDQQQLGIAWNDVDLCLKVQGEGYRNLWTPYARLFHHEGLSRGADNTRSQIRRVGQERQVMMQRWALQGFDDPAYHPLLARDNESFCLGKTVD